MAVPTAIPEGIDGAEALLDKPVEKVGYPLAGGPVSGSNAG